MKNRLGFSVFAITLMLMGIAVLPASTALVPINSESIEQSFESEDNGHTYLYVDGNLDWISQNSLVHDEDVNAIRYSYYSDYWSRSTTPYDGPATRDYSFLRWESYRSGWLDDYTMLPRFIDFENTTNDPLSVGSELERAVFPISFSEINSVVLDPQIPAYGTFNITDEEFVHMTIASRQDNIELEGYITDLDGIIFAHFYVDNGDVQVVPFKPDGAGVYIVYLTMWSYSNNLCVFDISFDSIAPIDFPVDSLVQGVLPGSEYAVENENGDLLHTEAAPTAITYKFRSNSTIPGRIRYSLNLPPLTNAVYDGFDPWIHVTSETYRSEMLTEKYVDELYINSGPYYFQSFQDEYYYMTVIGMENVEYNLYHDTPMVSELPINQEFYLENMRAERGHDIYSLRLSQDSILRVNTTGATSYSWSLWTVQDNMNYRELYIGHDPSIDNAPFYYLPAGNYSVIAEASTPWASGHFEFNLGPVLDGLGPISVDNGALVGVRFDTNVLDWYNVSVAFETHDNVTAKTDIYIFNTFGGKVDSYDIDLGNRQSGLGWAEQPSNYSTWLHNTFCDGTGIVVISPYQVNNNTLGIENEYPTYSLDYNISVEAGIPWKFNDTASLSVDTSPASHVFDLGEPGDNYEYYLLSLDSTPGVWMNVSVNVEAVLQWKCDIYQKFGTSWLSLEWESLDDTLIGSTDSDAGFQFGSVSDSITVVIWLERNTTESGVFNITFDAFTTNNFERMSPVEPQDTGPTEPPGPDMVLVAAGIGITVVAVVVVIVVILKKKPHLLGR